MIIVIKIFGRNTNLKAVQRLVKKYKLTGTIEGKSGSGRPVTATTAENKEPGTYKSPREIAPLNGKFDKTNGEKEKI